MSVTTVTTARLLLRGWRESDRDPFAAMNADPEVARYLPTPLDRASSDALVDRIVAHWAEHGFGLWAIERHDDGAFLGFTGLYRPAFEAHFTPAVEVGWRLAREAWGRDSPPRLHVRRSNSASRRSGWLRSCRSRCPTTSDRGA